MKFCEGRKNSWDAHLDTCTYGYNTSRHNSTKFTPFQLMFGRKAVLPVELEMQTGSSDEVLEEFISSPSIESNAGCLAKLIEARSITLNKALDNIEAAQEKQKAYYDRKHANSMIHYKIGREVLVKDLLRRKRKEGKMDYRWLGPYTIIKNLGKGLSISLR